MSLHSYQLKYIALITMIIDHCGIVFADYLSSQMQMLFRGIGRISFPIFCFLLVEGFFHSSNRNRYLIRLLLFSLLSEIPFDLAIHHADLTSFSSLMDWTHQNVFFTLALGMAAMIVAEHYQYYSLSWPLCALCFSCIADFCHTDYGSVGVVTILIFYLHKKIDRFPLWLCLLPLMVIAFNTPLQAACILSLCFISQYNGEKGQGPKYLFYLAYPTHFLLLYLLVHIVL